MLFIFGCAGSLLLCGFFSRCSLRASRCSGLSCCGAQALWSLGISSCDTWAQQWYTGLVAWDLSESGIELVSPVLQGRFLTTGQEGSFSQHHLLKKLSFLPGR